MRKNLGHLLMSVSVVASLVVVTLVGSWKPGPALDQGIDPSCVGYAAAGWRMAQPGPVYRLDGTRLYWEAKRRDGTKADGTYPDVMADILWEQGYIKSYTYSRNIGNGIYFLERGPFWLGINWYSDMSSPVNGVITATGHIESAHEVFCYAYSPQTDYLTCQNSWGPNWGNAGHFQIKAKVAQRILAGNMAPVLLPIKRNLQEKLFRWKLIGPKS